MIALHKLAVENERAAAGVPPPEVAGGNADPFGFYFNTLGFNNLADAGERRFFEALPSNFKLPAVTVDRLSEVGGRLLRESPEFQRLLAELRWGWRLPLRGRPPARS